MTAVYESHPVVREPYAPPMPVAPKQSLEDAARIILTRGACWVRLTDELIEENDARYRGMQNPWQVQERSPELMRKRVRHMLAEDAFSANYTDFHKNPLACAKYFDSRNAETQMPDVFHTATGTQYEIKVLHPEHDGFAFYPNLQSQIGEHPELIDYFMIVRGVFTGPVERPDVYSIKPIYIFPRSLLYRPGTAYPTEFVNVIRMNDPYPKKRTLWKLEAPVLERAVAEGYAMKAENTEPIHV
jgi:hypothetical protein